MKPSTYPEQLWAGTEHSLMLAVDAHERMLAGVLNRSAVASEEEQEGAPYNFRMHGSIGIVEIKGSLTNQDSFFNRYFGVTSYGDVRRALVFAANSPDVKTILLDIDSGGGAVSGVADAANLIRNIDAKVKPVHSFTDGMMGSAAYWLGASARKVHLSSTAVMGSVGVITTHKEYSKAFKEAGIGVTVIRAGKYKALANSFETLSESAQTQVQELLDGTYKVFIGWIADRRGTTVAVADEKMGQGREFLGEAAITAGLADAVESFDSVISKLSKQLDKQASTNQNSVTFPRGPNMKTALTDQEMSAIAAGAPLAGSEAIVADVVVGAVAAPAVEVTESENGTAAVAGATDAQAGLVEYLKGEVKSKGELLLAVQVSLAQASAQMEAMSASLTDLAEIAATSLSHMKVGMGYAAFNAAGYTPTQLVHEHKLAAAAFTKHFKVGGVAAVVQVKSVVAEIDPHRVARAAATRISK